MSLTGLFAHLSVRLLDVQPQDISPPIQRFLLIQLKPKHHRLDVLTTYLTVCVCHAELKSYLLIYLLTYLLTYLFTYQG